MPDETKPLQMSDLKRLPDAKQLPIVSPGFQDLQSFELLQRIARMFCSSPLVPKEYQGPEGLGSMVIVLNMAHRMQADPLMVAQSLFVVHGRPSWSAQFLIAAFNRCGRYSALRYEWQGKRGDKDWGCRAWAVELATGERVTGPLVTMATAEAEGWLARTGSKWKTIPELMLTYRAAAWMVRTNAPEIAMGLPTADEVDDVVTLTPDQYTVERVKAGEHAAGSGKTVDTSTSEITATGTAHGGAGGISVGGGTPGDMMPPPTLPDVLKAIAAARDHDELDLILDAARSLPEPLAAAEVDVAARARRKALGDRA